MDPHLIIGDVSNEIPVLQGMRGRLGIKPCNNLLVGLVQCQGICKYTTRSAAAFGTPFPSRPSEEGDGSRSEGSASTRHSTSVDLPLQRQSSRAGGALTLRFLPSTRGKMWPRPLAPRVCSSFPLSSDIILLVLSSLWHLNMICTLMHSLKSHLPARARK